MSELEQRVLDALSTLDRLSSDVDRWEQQQDVSAFAANDLRSYLRTLVTTLEGAES
ncbi:hypothetical protein AB2L28_20530 [Kineococcus sp. TBRC 1896]|uniref:Uncharacterized protein n=1 Tax=Kineococcus mangrovi TaxID=1660183 RepID=A0ABV4I7G4_9ACTN